MAFDGSILKSWSTKTEKGPPKIVAYRQIALYCRPPRGSLVDTENVTMWLIFLVVGFISWLWFPIPLLAADHRSNEKASGNPPAPSPLFLLARGKDEISCQLEKARGAIQEKISQLPKSDQSRVVMKVRGDVMQIEIKERRTNLVPLAGSANLIPPDRPVMEIIARELARLPYHLTEIEVRTSETDSPAQPPVIPSRINRPTKPNPGVDALINKYSAHYRVDPKLVKALISKESAYNPGAVSPKGAQGLMQLMPATATMLGVKNPFDPEQNIAGGISYLRYCLDCFQNDVAFAVAAYNAGPNNVIKYGSIPPFRETQLFVQEVMQSYLGQLPAINTSADKNSSMFSGRAGPLSSDTGVKRRTKFSPAAITITMIQVRPKKIVGKSY